jgi:hypothetical protein
MTFQSYMDVSMEETFDFFGHALLDYIRLVFMQAFQDDPALQTSLQGIFTQFLDFYTRNGLLANIAAASMQDMQHQAIDFRKNEQTHNSIFAFSANPVSDDKSGFDIAYDRTQAAIVDIRYAQRTYNQFDRALPTAFTASQARKLLAGEVIRSGQLMILASQELQNVDIPQENKDLIVHLEMTMKHYLKMVKSMESNIQYLHTTILPGYGENVIADADEERTTWLQLNEGAESAWQSIVEYWLHDMGLSDASFYQEFHIMEDRAMPLFVQYRRDSTSALKTYYCTQNYLLYWTHIVLSHYTANDTQWKDMDTYCKKFNKASTVHNNAGTRREIKRQTALEQSHEIMEFYAAEGSRKAWWEKNRVLRRRGHLKYIYSQDESPENHRYDRPADQEGIDLYETEGDRLPGVRGPMLRQENDAEKKLRLEEAQAKKEKKEQDRLAKKDLFKLPTHDKKEATLKAAREAAKEAKHAARSQGRYQQPAQTSTRGKTNSKARAPGNPPALQKPPHNSKARAPGNPPALQTPPHVPPAASRPANHRDRERETAEGLGLGGFSRKSNLDEYHQELNDLQNERFAALTELRQIYNTLQRDQGMDFEMYQSFDNRFNLARGEWAHLQTTSSSMLKSQLKDKISQDYKKLFAAEEQDVQIIIDKIQETMQQIQEDILRKEQAEQRAAEEKK